MSLLDLIRPGRRAAREKIEEALRHGVLPLDEIADHVSSSLEQEVDDEVLEAMVAESLRRMPVVRDRPTSLERLQAAFDALERVGILARHYPSAGRSEAHALVEHELAVAAQQGRTCVGYCFYDAPLLHMMSDGELAFCFGPAVMPRTYAQLWRAQVDVATQIVAALRDQRFRVEWSGEAADVVRIAGVEWVGARDASGAPTVPIGPQLEGSARSHRDDDPAPVVNVFVSCKGGSADAHRLLAKIASVTDQPMYGDVEHCATRPAAVAVDALDGVLLDLVAGEADPSPRGIMRRRDLANDCALLVALATEVDALDCPWWSSFEPDDRALVVTRGADASRHEGSIVLPLDLATGHGTTELLTALRVMAQREGA